MDILDSPELGGGKAKGTRAAAIAGLALAVFVVLAAVLISRFLAEERARDVAAWQVRLGIIADGRALALSEWVERQLAEVKGIAENASVQLYLSELTAADGDLAQVPDQAAQVSYLRNLLIVTAQRSGFAAPPAGPTVDASVRRPGIAGIVLLDQKRRLLAGTPDMPALEGRLAAWLASVPPGERALLDIYPGEDGAPAMAFLAPIFGIEGGSGPGQQLGSVVAVKGIAGEVFPLLRPPGPREPGAEAVLVRPQGAAIEYVSPLVDGTKPLERRLARDTPDLAEAFAAAAPGGFGLRRDYRGEEVLVTGRAVPPTPWTLVYKVDRDMALGESDRRGTRLAVIAGLALAVIVGVLVAVWYYASSRRATAAASALRLLARRFESQGALLRLITDSQPTAIFITDEAGHYRFANREAERRAGLSELDLLGKTLEQVVGPAASERTVTLNRQALESDTPVSTVERVERAGEVAVLQSAHIPLPPLSLAQGPDLPRSVLVVEHDVTDLARERERRERTLKQLVAAMTAAVDRRDRFASDQSTRVATLARAVALEMGLSPLLAETAETAGNLMNFGKLLVPPELLTKAEQLSDEERALIRASIQATADIIAGIEFDGPVVETLRQMQERIDGRGPRGLKGEAILVTARVVAVANAFVAMASPRAYRSGSDIDAALDALLREAGTAFDRRAVAALITHLESRGGRAQWAAAPANGGSAGSHHIVT